MAADGPRTSDDLTPCQGNCTAALRLIPRSFARFIGEFLKAGEISSCVITRIPRASVRASLPASASRGA